MKDVEAKPLTDEELERVIREMYFENVERKVKENGKVKFKEKWYHVGRKMSGETVEVQVTLKRVEVWHNGAFIRTMEILGICFRYCCRLYDEKVLVIVKYDFIIVSKK